MKQVAFSTESFNYAKGMIMDRIAINFRLNYPIKRFIWELA